ncbi:MSMEG_4193 family putative phosphomutase [Auraticoccus sp. F435]|uniref:MSMEG_4193 family putative phosphomutase n=1 Tax=Auraticoccus cholistanensis TaxID=2656650 RepID=A0A6A9UZ64_9ACTN|nr:MSMEG_4193 family putative phosphomutase [Auraticoccus cholistanensis]MVA77057.1 MSMEG_4193 family putative phosphomutase [Auraticoccus cholistanensis]
MTTLLLVRHGRTTANRTGVLAGRTPGVDLDGTGVEQARAAGRRIAGLPLAEVVSSPLRRCRHTAQLLVEGRSDTAPVVYEGRLTECGYGEWTGRHLKDLAKEKLWRTVQETPSAVRFPGGEAMTEMSARAVAAVRDRDAALAASAGDGAVWAAVSHGDVIKAVLADALGMHLDAFQRIVVDPASISVIRFTAGRPFVVAMNTTAGDLSHLAPPRGRSRRRTPPADAAVGGGLGSTE